MEEFLSTAAGIIGTQACLGLVACIIYILPGDNEKGEPLGGVALAVFSCIFILLLSVFVINLVR